MPDSRVACADVRAARLIRVSAYTSALPELIPASSTQAGSALVYALTRISLAARTSAHATRLSGMAQSIGYLVAASGPVVVGWLRDSTGSWTPALAFVAGLAVVQATAAALRLRSR